MRLHVDISWSFCDFEACLDQPGDPATNPSKLDICGKEGINRIVEVPAPSRSYSRFEGEIEKVEEESEEERGEQGRKAEKTRVLSPLSDLTQPRISLAIL